MHVKVELLTTVNCREGHMNACKASIFGDKRRAVRTSYVRPFQAEPLRIILHGARA